jgi:integrase
MTYEDYALCVRRLVPHIGHIRLRALTPEHIQEALGALSRRGLAPRTIRHVNMVLRRALKQAVLWRLLAHNPSDAVRPPRQVRFEHKVLNQDEVRRLLEVMKGTRQYALFVFLATTGCRVGEALGLRWEDVDLPRSTASIRRSLQVQPGVGLVSVEPKSERSRRTLPLPPETVNALAEHRRTQERDRGDAGDQWNETGYVFTNPTGGPRNPKNLRWAFTVALLRAGLPPVRIHDLRHSAATHLLTMGVHPKVVQDLLGHSTIAITLDTYSHVMPALAREASRFMDGLVPSDSKT